MHRVNNGVVIRARHEAFERTEPADREHFEVRQLESIQPEGGKARGLGFELRGPRARNKAVDELSSMRLNHLCPLLFEFPLPASVFRSEERRVGKEGRSRASRAHAS